MSKIKALGLPNKIKALGLGNIEVLEAKKIQSEPDNEDFLPIVRINNSEKSKNCIVSVADCASEKINLGIDFDDDLRNYTVPDIVITKNSKAYIPLQNIQGYDGWGYQDGDGILEFRTNNAKAKIRLLSEKNPEKINTNSKTYDLKDAEFGDQYTLEIFHTLNRGDKFSIEIYASDDNDGIWGRSKKTVKCGKLNFTVIQQDVFMVDELKKGFDLLSIISQEHKKRPTTGEYSVNYCIQGADRFLGAIVDNKKDFYAYDDKSQQLIYSPGFTTAIDRAKKIEKLGYGRNYKEFDGGIFGIQEVNKIDKYGNNPSRKLSLKTNGKEAINNYFQTVVKNKIGIHIFYLSIVEAFHTLFIVIDNTNPCDPTYKIYDEDGETSSYGQLKTIGDGLVGQSQWVYTWAKPKFGYWAKLNVSLLKFQRK
ncbi:hypothetical protein NZ698_14610 [Chryseobacterium sp. PBS4-4]|uniref:Uncharacterized protein n=1 Tax=Chryseobacterium edaphi TaxID=2976532 RepID=A0ABT2W8A8_9FLAO|nr:hypothetical protein [Chryseobacterium edaphi]MCU7618429.1 hypothetical protein [Chryseobacterium edaphi]